MLQLPGFITFNRMNFDARQQSTGCGIHFRMYECIISSDAASHILTSGCSSMSTWITVIPAFPSVVQGRELAFYNPKLPKAFKLGML